MPAITINSFGGEVPKATPRLLESSQAVRAVNCKLDRGHLEPLAGPKLIEVLAGPAKTIFKHEQDGWLSWEKAVNVVKSAVHDVDGDAPLGHLFITGDRNYPTQYLRGGTVHRLGVPRPGKKPKVEIALGAQNFTVQCHAFGTSDPEIYPPRYGYEKTMEQIKAGSAAAKAILVCEAQADALAEGITTDSGIERSSSYCYTLVQTLAGGRIQQESAPSPPSEIVDVLDGDGVKISGFEIPRLPGSNITHIRIYRTLSGLQTSEFHFLVELTLPVAEHIDTVLDKDLSSEVLQTSTWDAIPDDAQGLIATNNGIYPAFRGNELLVSVPFHAYAFPTDYRFTVEDKIVALGHTDNTIIILTEGRPYLASGSDPAQMQITRLPIEQGCLAALSLGHVPGGLIYASPDGLMQFTASDQGLITAGTFTREQWQGLEPAHILGAVLDNKYFGFFAGGNEGFILALGNRDVTRLELPADAAVRAVCHHSLDDCVYLCIEKDGQWSVQQWGAGAPLKYKWRSKPFFTSVLCSMRALRVEGEQRAGTPAEVNVYGPDRKRPRQKLELQDTRTKRLASFRSEKEWSLEIIGTATVYEARIGGNVEEVECGA